MGSVINIFKCSIWPIQDYYIAESLNNDPKNKPEKFWPYIKAKRQDQIGIPPLKSDAGLKVDSLGKAELLILMNFKKYLHRKMYHLFLINAFLVQLVWNK